MCALCLEDLPGLDRGQRVVDLGELVGELLGLGLEVAGLLLEAGELVRPAAGVPLRLDGGVGGGQGVPCHRPQGLGGIALVNGQERGHTLGRVLQTVLSGPGLSEAVELLACADKGFLMQRRQRFKQDLRQPALVDTVADVGRAQRVQELEQAVVAVPARVAV